MNKSELEVCRSRVSFGPGKNLGQKGFHSRVNRPEPKSFKKKEYQPGKPKKVLPNLPKIYSSLKLSYRAGEAVLMGPYRTSKARAHL